MIQGYSKDQEDFRYDPNKGTELGIGHSNPSRKVVLVDHHERDDIIRSRLPPSEDERLRNGRKRPT